MACFPAHIRYWLCARIRPNLPEIARNVPDFARNAPEFARITYKFPLKRPKYISGTFRALGIRARKIRPNSPEIYFGRSKYDVHVHLFFYKKKEGISVNTECRDRVKTENIRFRDIVAKVWHSLSIRKHPELMMLLNETHNTYTFLGPYSAQELPPI